MYRVLIVALMMLALMASRCHDGCAQEETKCEDGNVYVCNSQQDWELSVDCGDISHDAGMTFVCCLDTDGIHSCIPEQVGCEQDGSTDVSGGDV